jgi:FkbM family methyltransferase
MQLRKLEKHPIGMPFFHRLAFWLAWHGVVGSHYYWTIFHKFQSAVISQTYILGNGFPIAYDADDWTSRTIYEGTYERPLLKFINRLNCQTHVIDVGANIGVTLWHSLANSNSATYWAFEPATQPFRKLTDLCRYLPNNGFTFNQALGNAEGVANLFGVNNLRHSGLATLRPRDDSSNSNFEEVRITSLDNVVAKMGFTKAINLLKIDVEGFEPEVLAGSEALILTGNIEVIIIEVSPDLVNTNYLNQIHGWTKSRYGWFELYEKGSFVRKVKLREISPDKALSLSKQWNLIIARNDIALDLMKSRF